MTDVPTTSNLICARFALDVSIHLKTLRVSRAGALETAASGVNTRGLTRIRYCRYRMQHQQEPTHVRNKTMRGGTPWARPRTSHIANPSLPIDGADLAAAADQVHRDPWPRERRGFRYPPPRRSVEQTVGPTGCDREPSRRRRGCRRHRRHQRERRSCSARLADIRADRSSLRAAADALPG